MKNNLSVEKDSVHEDTTVKNFAGCTDCERRKALIDCLKSDAARAKVMWTTGISAAGGYLILKALGWRSYPRYTILGCGIIGWITAKFHNVHACTMQVYLDLKNPWKNKGMDNNTLGQWDEESFPELEFSEPLEVDNTFVNVNPPTEKSTQEASHIKQTTSYAELRRQNRAKDYSQNEIVKGYARNS